MKILFYGISTHLGGAERSLLELIDNLESEAITHKLQKSTRLEVLLPKKTGPIWQELKERNIPISLLKMPNSFLSTTRKHLLKSLVTTLFELPSLILYVKNYSTLLRRQEIQQVYSVGLKCHMINCLISSFHPNVRFIIHMRDMLKLKPLKLFFYLFKNKKNIYWLANSRCTAESLPQIKSEVLYNTFNEASFSNRPQRNLRKELGLNKDTFIIGHMAAWSEWKGQHYFIRACLDLLKSHPELHFFIAGDVIYDSHQNSDYKKTLLALIKSSSHAHRFHFLGFVNPSLEFYKNINIFVHSSLKPEPFGRVVVEAMLCECTVVASDKGGTQEIIENNINGVLYSTEHEKNLVKSLQELIDNKARQEELKKNALLTARNHFSRSAMSPKIIKCFHLEHLI